MYAMQLRCRRPSTRTVRARGKVPGSVGSTGKWESTRKPGEPEASWSRTNTARSTSRRRRYEREGGGDRAREGDGDRAQLRRHRASAARRAQGGGLRLKHVDPAVKATLEAERVQADQKRTGGQYAPWFRWYYSPWQQAEPRDDRAGAED